jgi:hypothetical protein
MAHHPTGLDLMARLPTAPLPTAPLPMAPLPMGRVLTSQITTVRHLMAHHRTGRVLISQITMVRLPMAPLPMAPLRTVHHLTGHHRMVQDLTEVTVEEAAEAKTTAAGATIRSSVGQSRQGEYLDGISIQDSHERSCTQNCVADFLRISRVESFTYCI